MADDAAVAVLQETIAGWVDDPESDVVYAERVQSGDWGERWAVRMRQTVREATTVWFWVGDRSLIAEAYVLPVMTHALEMYHQALMRNGRAFRVHFALDSEGALVLRSRMPVDRVTSGELSFLIAEVYQTVEASFRPLHAAGGQRENKR